MLEDCEDTDDEEEDEVESEDWCDWVFHCRHSTCARVRTNPFLEFRELARGLSIVLKLVKASMDLL